MKKIRYILKKIFIILLTAIISIFIYKLYEEVKRDSQTPNTYGTKLSADESESVNLQNKEISNVIEETSKCVVGISKIKNIGSTAFLSDVTGRLGLGTGTIISKQGYILTNYHVAGETGQVCYVTIEDGKIYKAKVIWANSDIDLALIKVEQKFNIVAKIGNSDGIKIGENVYAIGNPIGYEFQRTVTAGIISAVDRTVKIKNDDDSYSYMSNLIQTDATINPGNSGGPLIDIDGNIIGINSIKITSAEGIGFAIPINIIKPIIEKIEQNENFKEAYLGIFAYDGSVMSYIKEDTKTLQGVYIEEIINNGPAEKGGLKNGDIIFKIDETNISKMIELQEYIFRKKPGDEINIGIIRNDERLNVKVLLEEK